MRALASIAMQTEFDSMVVTIVDDQSPQRKRFKKIVHDFGVFTGTAVNYIDLDENVGPGIARQVGINNTECPYIMFVDSDDQLASKFSVKLLLSAAMNNDFHVVLSDFTEELHQNPDPNVVQVFTHKRDFTWVFGKLYKREALAQGEITFNPNREFSYANEDSGFNTLVNLKTDDKDIGYVDFPTYVWSGRADSITRANMCEYNFNAGFIGFVENQFYAIDSALNTLLPSMNMDKLRNQVFISFMNCYKTAAECFVSIPHRKAFFNLDMDYSRRFYIKYKSIIMEYVMRGAECLNFMAQNMAPFVLQQFTLYTFLKLLDEQLDVSKLMDAHSTSLQ
jgi:glycosyltransferase involved in cell wall biosynthesis